MEPYHTAGAEQTPKVANYLASQHFILESELAQRIARRQLSSVEVVDAHLARIVSCGSTRARRDLRT